MRFNNAIIAIKDDDVIISQCDFDVDGQLNDNEIILPPEQAIIIAEEMRRLALALIEKSEGKNNG